MGTARRYFVGSMYGIRWHTKADRRRAYAQTKQREGAATCLVNGGDDLEQLVIRQVLERELALRHVPRVGFPEHGVPVPGDHLMR